jgi:hypothetical protein
VQQTAGNKQGNESINVEEEKKEKRRRKAEAVM